MVDLIDESYQDIKFTDFISEYSPQKWKEFFGTPEIEYLIYEIADRLDGESIQMEKEEKVIYPPRECIFRVFYHFDIDQIKVVILGQDPYHNGSATGFSFEVKKGAKVNPSLKRVFEEVENSVPPESVPPSSPTSESELNGKHPWLIKNKNNGSLTKWANQGVFLYNTYLTVVSGSPNSHSDIWNEFSNKFISYLTKNSKSGIVFLLWGGKAEKLRKYIVNEPELKGGTDSGGTDSGGKRKGRHKIISCGHPSPLNTAGGFLGSNCFSRANKCLRDMGKEEIDWSL